MATSRIRCVIEKVFIMTRVIVTARSKRLYQTALRVMKQSGDERKAYKLLIASLKEGDARAAYALATWYLYGKFLNKNKRKARELLVIASDGGIADASFDLAVMYESGDGIRKDTKKAARYYFRSFLLNDKRSYDSVARLFYWGIGVEMNRGIAKELVNFYEHGDKENNKFRSKACRETKMAR